MENHTFHIPVMGVAYTIDSPLKVAHLGISSCISLLDDVLLEKLRKVFCEKFNQPYQEITKQMKDHRANRITEYLNLINKISNDKFQELKNSNVSDFLKHINLLPENSPIKCEFKRLKNLNTNIQSIRNQLKDMLTQGSIDVNIMTKVDKQNYFKGEALSSEYNDAHAALRGFATSDLSSSVVLSAGMNPRLYSYIEKFSDFFPDKNMNLKKKIILKVSDFRSALIQGKFLAKKGIWVSEYRIESGLNCGGHAFASDGTLMGPVLEMFKTKRKELRNSVHKVLQQALKQKDLPVPEFDLPLKISAQGGIGTNAEHELLLKEYKIDSVGWGTPFLLVPEATCIDTDTISLLEKANAQDLYLSNISPLGVPFNSVRGNTKDMEQRQSVISNNPGSHCPRAFVKLNTEFSKTGLCTASKQYQKQKIAELKTRNLTTNDYQKAYNKIVEKSCICVGLGTPALINYNIPHKTEGNGVSVCPGPNMEFFSSRMQLTELVQHIYGNNHVLNEKSRPHVFINELKLYLRHIKKEILEAGPNRNEKQNAHFNKFINNLQDGIDYYRTLFDRIKTTKTDLKHLNDYQIELNRIKETLTEASETTPA